MAERMHPETEPQVAPHGLASRAVGGCLGRAIIATGWCLVGASVIVVAWNVVFAPLAGLARMTFGQGVALMLLVELIAHLFERGRRE